MVPIAVFAILVAALISAMSMWLTGSIARRLGASAFGEALAMTATAIAPELLALPVSIR